jgi:hypothetical protein
MRASGLQKPHDLNLAVLRALNLFPPAVLPAKNVPVLGINQGLAVA